jgi:hypothetical protein
LELFRRLAGRRKKEAMLTDDMKHLCGEILALRNNRDDLMNHLARESRDRSKAVAGLCGQFASMRAAMGRRTKSERMSFLNNLKRTVAAQQRAVQSDLAGVRRIWAGRAA